MTAHRIGLAAAAMALLAAAAPMAAAQDGAVAALTITSPPTKAERAAQLRQEAESLFSQPKQWKKAVRLLEESAALREPSDPEGFECLLYAGRIRVALGDLRGARENLENAAALALARGAVDDAAHAFIDAAHAAMQLNDGEGARTLVARAALLTESPLLDETQRRFLKSRIKA